MTQALALVRHNKTGNIYIVQAYGINATNSVAGQPVVVYTRDGETYVREIGEFLAKFTRIEG